METSNGATGGALCRGDNSKPWWSTAGTPVGLHDGQAERCRPLHRLVRRRDDLRALRQPVHDGRRAVEQLPEAADDDLHVSQPSDVTGSGGNSGIC